MSKYSHVAKLPWPEMEGCYLTLSCHKTNEANGVRPVVSFLCIVGNVAAEWEPKNGPIQLWYRGEDEEHYTFPRIRTPSLDFSQLSVEREGLPQMVNAGNYAGVFEVLRTWTNREPPEENPDNE